MLHRRQAHAGDEPRPLKPGGARVLGASLPLAAIAVATVLGGMRVQSRLRPESYRRLMRAVLWAMACLLLAQVGWKVALLSSPR